MIKLPPTRLPRLAGLPLLRYQRSTVRGDAPVAPSPRLGGSIVASARAPVNHPETLL